MNVTSSSWETVKTKAQALTRLFEEILDLDLRIFTVTLDMLPREPSESRRQRILIDYDLSPERIYGVPAKRSGAFVLKLS